MNRISRKTLGFITLSTLLVLSAIALFIKFDHKITGPARFVAYSEWILVNSEQDKLQSNHYYNGLQNRHDMVLFHFERPDFVQFSLNADLQFGTMVNEGEVVAQFLSSEDAIRLAELSGEVTESRASLSALETGEKEALQREASEALTYAKAELAAYEPVLKRQKELHAKNLISDQELEISQAQYDLYSINVSVQKARLQSSQTGQKVETIAIIEAEIDAVSKQLELFQKKLDASSIKSPVHGILVQPDRANRELCHICEIDSMIVQMPVKASDIQHVEIGMPMIVNVPGSTNKAEELSVRGIDFNASMINLQPMYIVSAVLPNTDRRVKHGMTGNIEIIAGQATLLDMLSQSWKSFRFNK